ncbi:MAG: hypothetical protein WC789_12465 [Lentisphaeria bacterium]|jgi:hypothetical protein
MHRQRHLFLALLLFLCGGKGSRAELYLVSQPQADLFHNHRRAASLGRGTVVEAEPLPEAPAWLTLTLQRQTYEAERKLFLSESELHATSSGRLADAASAIQALARRLDAAAARRQELTWALLAVRVDRTLVYATLQPAHVQPAPPPHPPVTVPVVRYVDKINAADARRAVKEWSAELATLTREFQALERQRQEAAATQQLAEQQAAEGRRLFAAYRANPADYRRDRHLVTAASADLFQNRRIIAALPAGTVADASPGPVAGWLLVHHQGQWHESPAKGWQSRAEILAEFAARQAQDAQRLVALEAEIRFRSAVTEQMAQIATCLRLESGASHYPLPASPFRAGLPGVALLRQPTLTAAAGEYVIRGRARELLAELAAERQELERGTQALESQVATLRRRLAERQSRHNSLLPKLQAAP